MSIGFDARRLYDTYLEQHAHFVRCAADFEAHLRRLVEDQAGNKAVVSARAKDPLELFKKQIRKKYLDPWTDCPDIVGARVIVGTRAERSVVVDILAAAETIHIERIEDQSESADPNEIRYRGLHVHVTSSTLRTADDTAIRCEVQIRTMAEHAWAETDHRYVYKKGEIPANVRRHFNRLLVLMELFDIELEEGIAMARELDGFRRLELAQHLEATMSRLTRAPGDHHLTMEAVELLEESGLGSPIELRSLVDDYLDSHLQEVQALIADRGPRAPGHDVSRDWMLSQGESILLLALLDSDEYRLSNALNGSELYGPTESLALATNHVGFVRG